MFPKGDNMKTLTIYKSKITIILEKFEASIYTLSEKFL